MQRTLKRKSYTKSFTKQTWFIIRVEPYYHKLQYSKVPKGDPAGLILGLFCAMFIFYITLATFGSGGADLADIQVLIWYLGLILLCFYLYQRNAQLYRSSLNPINVFNLYFNWLLILFFKKLNVIKQRIKRFNF